MIRNYKHIGYVVALFTAAFIASCGGASAPPVDLPAPVTGQIDISGPNADGKSTITGTAGAVTGGAIVLAINERIEAAASESPLLKMLDAVVPTAYAGTTLPAVCDEPGHWCVIAEADGSFTMEIDAVVDDTIILVLIDESGVEISDRSSIVVPAGSGIAACGSGYEGNLVALTNLGGVVYALHEGSTDSANKIFIGSQEFEVPGCYAQDIAVFETSDGSILIAVVSSSDNKLWIGQWDGSNITLGLTYTLDIVPYKVAFGGDSTEVIVGGTGGSVHLELISVADGSTINSLALPNTDLNSVVALDTVGPFADGGYLGLIVGSDGTWYYLTFFHASTFTNVTSSSGEIPLDSGTLILSDDPEVADAHFGINASAGNAVRFLFSDHFSFSPAFRNNPIGIPGFPAVNLGFNASSLSSLTLGTPTVSIAQSATKYPHRFVPAPLSTPPTAYVLTDDGYLWRIIDYLSAGATQDLFSLSSILPDPVAIAIDETGTSLIGGNAAGTTADLSSYISP